MNLLNPHLLDVVKRNSDYALYYAGKPLTTPSGAETAYHDRRLLEHMLRELSLSCVLDPHGLDAYGLFSAKTALDKEAGRAFPLDEMIKADPLVGRRIQREPDDSDSPETVLDAFDEKHCMAFYFSGMTGALGSLEEFLCEEGLGGLEVVGSSPDEFVQAVSSVYERMPSAKRAVLLSLCAAHESGVILPLLLILRNLTASEYANALYSIHTPFSGKRTKTSFNKRIQPILRKTTVLPDWNEPAAGFAGIREQAASAMEYLACYDHRETKSPGVGDLIRMGEHFGLEFKSCLRWNLKTGQKDQAIEQANMKTIAAFLNSNGGTLLIGVRDDGTTEGIETDGFPDHDRFSLHFWNLVKSRLGQEICPFIRTSFENIGERSVFVVECAKSHTPVFLGRKQDEDEFFIRVGPSSAKLTIREALKYIAQRFEDGQACR